MGTPPEGAPRLKEPEINLFGNRESVIHLDTQRRTAPVAISAPLNPIVFAILGGYALVEPISVNSLDGLALVATGFWLHPQRREKRRSECFNASRASN
jgi:hypothetical protein